jgi:hypothetical protein
MEVSETTYCINVGTDVMLSILDRDWGDLPLYEVLEETTDCHKVEYDGHTGPYIFVSVIKEYDTAIHTAKIMTIIHKYATGGRFRL